MVIAAQLGLEQRESKCHRAAGARDQTSTYTLGFCRWTMATYEED